jgi:hypothetical protein
MLADVKESAGITGVVINELSAEVEYVQRRGQVAHLDVLGWATSISGGSGTGIGALSIPAELNVTEECSDGKRRSRIRIGMQRDVRAS